MSGPSKLTEVSVTSPAGRQWEPGHRAAALSELGSEGAKLPGRPPPPQAPGPRRLLWDPLSVPKRKIAQSRQAQRPPVRTVTYTLLPSLRRLVHRETVTSVSRRKRKPFSSSYPQRGPPRGQAPPPPVHTRTRVPGPDGRVAVRLRGGACASVCGTAPHPFC